MSNARPRSFFSAKLFSIPLILFFLFVLHYSFNQDLLHLLKPTNLHILAQGNSILNFPDTTTDNKSTRKRSRVQESDSYDLFLADEVELVKQQEEHHTPSKKILFWNGDYDGGRNYGIGLGKDVFKKAGCPIWQCEAYDTQMEHDIPTDNFDAIIFHDPTWWDKTNIPSIRSSNQRYVLWVREAPGTLRSVTAWREMKNFYNWTMTHRWDSDIVHPYGWISPRHEVPLHPNSTHLTLLKDATKKGKNYAAGKTKLVALFLSNCNISTSGRNEYIQQLQKFIPVDIFGKCGNRTSCPKDAGNGCRELIAKEYKFYLAFENSLCLDYVTEKFFSQMQFNNIPIVLDLHGNQEAFSPTHSYINALDFSTVKGLADYLKLLDGNDTLYNEYFWWKEYFSVYDYTSSKRGMCHLCTLLHRPDSETKIYNDLTQWWVKKAECKTLVFDNRTSEIDDPIPWKIIQTYPLEDDS